MRLSAALVCIAVLYGIDALAFDGRYVTGISHELYEIYVHW